MSGDTPTGEVVDSEPRTTNSRVADGMMPVIGHTEGADGVDLEVAVESVEPTLSDSGSTRKKSDAILQRGANISAARRAAADAKRKRDLVYMQRQSEGDGSDLIHMEELQSSAATRRNVSQVKEKRKERVNWSPEEVNALKQGIQKWGPGKWAVILRDYADEFHESRISVDLKDKWRNIFPVPGKKGKKKRKRAEMEMINEDEAAAKRAKFAFSRADDPFPHAAILASSPEEADALMAEAQAEAAQDAAAQAEALLRDYETRSFLGTSAPSPRRD